MVSGHLSEGQFSSGAIIRGQSSRGQFFSGAIVRTPVFSNGDRGKQVVEEKLQQSKVKS